MELADFANNDLVKALEGRDDLLKGNYNDESSTKLINGKPVFGPVKPEWLIKGLPNPHNIKRIRAGVYGQELPEESSQKDTAPETQGTKEKELIASNVTPADKNDEKNKSSTTDSLISTESQKKSHPTAKADNKSTTTSKKHDHQSSSDNESNDSDDSDSSSSQPPDDVPYSPNEPAIPTSELLELELIADDIDDESDFEAGPEAFGMDTDGDGENEFGEDDDEDEDEFGRTRGSLFPSQYTNRIQEEISKLRSIGKSALESSNSAIADNDEYTPEEEEELHIIDAPVTKEKKRVRFSETIEIKRFEKKPPKKKPANSTGMISPHSRTEPIKDNSTPPPSTESSKETKPPKVSRFKLERMESGASQQQPVGVPTLGSQPPRPIDSSRSVISDTVLERDPIPVVPPSNANFEDTLKKNTVHHTSTDAKQMAPVAIDTASSSSSNAAAGNQSGKNGSTSSSSTSKAPVQAQKGHAKAASIDLKSPTSSRAHVSSSVKESASSRPPTAPAPAPSKKKMSRFKVQVQESRNPPMFPVSNRIEELESYQMKTEKEKQREKAAELKKKAFTTARPDVSEMVGDIKEKDTVDLDTKNGNGVAEKKPISKTIDQNAKNKSKSSLKSTEGQKETKIPHGQFDSTGSSINPALVKGLRSLFPQSVLEKANQYYEDSLMSEEDFIKAHLGDENEKEADAKNTESEDEKKKKEAAAKEAEKPILAETLVEREVAPDVDGIGMGYLPDQHVKTLKKNKKENSRPGNTSANSQEDLDDYDDDDEDFSVSRHELLQEYQKVRQTLIYQTGGYGKSPEELEEEPVNEPTKRVSRFKMARLSNRRF